MSIYPESDGRRSVKVEVEVTATPEQAWEAIASGPGISSWFVPCVLDPRDGGEMTLDFGGGMISAAKITTWNPPHQFTAESGDFGPDAPIIATEWTVESRSGGKCLIRVVHSHFSDDLSWDSQLESIESGWPAYFAVLSLYLHRFSGEKSASCQTISFTPGTSDAAWQTLVKQLGTYGMNSGQPWTSPDGAPACVGSIDSMSESGEHKFEVVEMTSPFSGSAFIAVCQMGDSAYVGLTFHKYGDQSDEGLTDYQMRWQNWMDKLFPPAQA